MRCAPAGQLVIDALGGCHVRDTDIPPIKQLALIVKASPGLVSVTLFGLDINSKPQHQPCACVLKLSCALLAGPWPCSRRSHAAVILGDSLWVHGGLDGSGQHLQDLWRLDLTSWQWQQLGGKVRHRHGMSEMTCHCQAQQWPASF